MNGGGVTTWKRELWGLETCTRTDTVLVIGGSQHGGSDTGQYGSLVAPYIVKPPTITIVRNGVALNDYGSLPFVGIEPGLAYVLSQAGKTCTLVCRFVDATTADDWRTTHLATAAADLTALGKVPAVVLYVIGKNDSISATQVGNLAVALRKLQAAIDLLWPGCGTILLPIVATDPAITNSATARVIALAHAQDRTGRRSWIDHTNIPLQLDLEHGTAAGYVTLGERHGRRILEANCLL